MWFCVSRIVCIRNANRVRGLAAARSFDLSDETCRSTSPRDQTGEALESFGPLVNPGGRRGWDRALPVRVSPGAFLVLAGRRISSDSERFLYTGFTAE